MGGADQWHQRGSRGQQKKLLDARRGGNFAKLLTSTSSTFGQKVEDVVRGPNTFLEEMKLLQKLLRRGQLGTLR